MPFSSKVSPDSNLDRLEFKVKICTAVINKPSHSNLDRLEFKVKQLFYVAWPKIHSNLDRLEFKVDSGARISLPIVFEFRQIGI